MQVEVNFAAGEKVERPVPLSLIRTSHNPRKSLRGVLEIFHEKGAAHNPPEVRQEFIDLIDKEFPHIRQRAESFRSLGGVEGKAAPSLKGQLQAVTLRRYESKGEDRYGVIQGESRTLAWGLIEAETGVPQKVRAVVEPKMTLEEAFERALAENLEREDMSPLDTAESLYEYLTVRVNPATVKANLPDGTANPLYDAGKPEGRPYTLTEVAQKFKREYHWVRGRAALVYLSDADKRQVQANWRAGKRDLTRFCKKACQIATERRKAGQTAGVATAAESLGDATTEPQTEPTVVVTPERRRRVATLKEVVEKFDNTPLANTERLATLAEVMGVALESALTERIQREEAAKQRAAAKTQPLQVQADAEVQKADEPMVVPAEAQEVRQSA